VNKLLNVVFQVCMVLIFGGAAFFAQSPDESSAVSQEIVGIVALTLVLCWLVLTFFRSVRFYWVTICLLLAWAGGQWAATLVSDPMPGYLSSLVAVFLVLGISMVCYGDRLSLFFLRKLKMPLAGWVLLALLIDGVVDVIFFKQSLGLNLVRVKVYALLAGVVVGFVAKVVSYYGAKIAVGSGEKKPAKVKAPKRQKAPRKVKPPKIAKPKKPKAARNPAKVPTPATGSKEAVASTPKPSPKTSVLDAKLEALCSGGGTKKKASEPSPKDTSGPDAPKEEPAVEEVPKTTETGKIVSSVDFG
jgi:hypothetical protein